MVMDALPESTAREAARRYSARGASARTVDKRAMPDRVRRWAPELRHGHSP